MKPEFFIINSKHTLIGITEEAKNEEKIIIPDGIKRIASSVFKKCTNLREVIIPDSVAIIDDNAFCACNSLIEIIIPNGIEIIKKSTFSNCSSLKRVLIPNSVTTIDDSAFWGCTSLEKITIPDSVTTIGDKAFAYCTNLLNITIPNSVTNIKYNSFEDTLWITNIINANELVVINNILIDTRGCIDDNLIIPEGITKIIDKSICANELTFNNIAIPASIKCIEPDAFRALNSINNIYYAKNETAWNYITNGCSNKNILSASIHFNA